MISMGLEHKVDGIQDKVIALAAAGADLEIVNKV